MKIIALSKQGLRHVGEFHEMIDYMIEQFTDQTAAFDHLLNLPLNTESKHKLQLRPLMKMFEESMEKYRNAYDGAHKSFESFTEEEMVSWSGMPVEELKKLSSLTDDDFTYMMRHGDIIQIVEAEKKYAISKVGYDSLREYLEQLDTLAELTHIENPDSIEESILRHMGEYGQALVRIRDMFEEKTSRGADHHGGYNRQWVMRRGEEMSDEELREFQFTADEIYVDQATLDLMTGRWRLLSVVDNNPLDRPL